MVSGYEFRIASIGGDGFRARAVRLMRPGGELSFCWLRRLDSNQRSSAYEADGLPTFLPRETLCTGLSGWIRTSGLRVPGSAVYLLTIHPVFCPLRLCPSASYVGTDKGALAAREEPTHIPLNHSRGCAERSAGAHPKWICLVNRWSRRRDSNPRLSRWQRTPLPAEVRLHL